MTIIALDHVQLAMPAGREAEGRAFYAGLLGLPERDKPEPLRARGGCWFERGPVKVHLGVEEGFAPARKAHPAFRVDDLSALNGPVRIPSRFASALSHAASAGSISRAATRSVPARSTATTSASGVG